jgi:Fe-S oxidoreductase
VLLVLGYPDVYAAGDHVPTVLAGGPQGLEGLDDRLVRDMQRQNLHPGVARLLPEGGGWLLAEFGGRTPEEARERARALMERLSQSSRPPSMHLLEHPEQQHAVWLVRESGLGATAHVPGQPLTWEGWEDSAVPPDRLGDYLRDLRGVLDRHGYLGDLYGHFGDGCVHTRIDFDFGTPEGRRTYRHFLDEAADLVTRYGGSFSGEHGDGQARGALLPRLFGPELVEAFREFKGIWDPEGRLNPGKVIDADPPTAHLRLGADYNPSPVETHFTWPDDGGDFNRALLRCVGVGACRKIDTGTMCPSYMVTRDEMHATRGRARLLFEMLRGSPVAGGWRDESVREALDLCLACKGCKGECPVRVDMATYKAEFLAHYYRGRLRPVHAYAFGLIPWWVRIAALLPWTAHKLTSSRAAAAVMKRLAGVAPARRIPPFAARPFDASKRRSGHAAGSDGGPRVLLWPDTFNGHFHPGTSSAAIGLLERAGFDVILPDQQVCCGRPLYDYGMLDLAKRCLNRTLDVLRHEIRAGTPVVVLEPSCASVFQDELQNLLPGDEDARRLGQQTLSLAELLEREAARFAWPMLEGRAVLHGHCHEKALRSTEAETAVLRRLGLDVEVLDSGCCGMAGAFGFETDHYDVSMAVGSRVLLPAVRRADSSTFIVADGFSCREQIAQATSRRALHLADVLAIAHDPTLQPATPFAETALLESRRAAAPRHPSAAEALVLASLAAVPVLLWQAWRRNRSATPQGVS